MLICFSLGVEFVYETIIVWRKMRNIVNALSLMIFDIIAVIDYTTGSTLRLAFSRSVLLVLINLLDSTRCLYCLCQVGVSEIALVVNNTFCLHCLN